MKPLLLLAGLLLTSSVQGYSQKVILDRLVFGTYYGMCHTNCMHIYRVDERTLEKDDSVKYGALDWAYYFTPVSRLDESKHALAKKLIAEVPVELLSRNRSVIGCPDCADQGGIFIQAFSGPVSATFKLDVADTDDQTPTVIAFKKKLLAVMAQLRK